MGQVVFVEWKRASGRPDAPPKIAAIPFKQGKLDLLIFEESQVLGIIADNLEEYAAIQRGTSEAATAAKLLDIN